MAEKRGRKAALTIFVLSVAAALALLVPLLVDTDGYQVKFLEIAGILVPRNINASNHLYPYLASAFTCGCILLVIMAIIIFGGDLGSEE